MHLGLICHEYPPCNHGGIGSFTKDLSEGLVKLGYQVSVIGIYTQSILELNNVVVEQNEGVTIYRYPEINRFGKVQLNHLYNRWHLYKCVSGIHKDKPFDLIESPESQGWLPFGLPGKIPFITRFHGGESYFGIELNRRSSHLSKLLEKQQIIHSDAVVSVSDHTAKVTLGLFALSIPYTVIYNSIHVPDTVSRFDHPPAIKHRIVFAGSVIPKKGVRELVEAMNVIFKQYPDAKLHIAGKNNYMIGGVSFKDIMLNSLDKRSYRDRVIFLGGVDRESVLFPLLASSEVCCFPSYSEAFSLTPLESMAIGKPVIFTKLSSGPETIEDGVTGLLCDPSSPKDIAEKIAFYFDNPEKAKIIAENGKKRIFDCFSYEKWLELNINYYLSLIQLNNES